MINKATSHMLGKLLEIPVVLVPDCWLEAGVYREGPATFHLDTVFHGFSPSSSKCWDGSKVSSCYCMLLGQPSRIKFVRIIPLAHKSSLFPHHFHAKYLSHRTSTVSEAVADVLIRFSVPKFLQGFSTSRTARGCLCSFLRRFDHSLVTDIT